MGDFKYALTQAKDVLNRQKERTTAKADKLDCDIQLCVVNHVIRCVDFFQKTFNHKHK